MGTTLKADELLYRYEADALPNASEGWFTNLGSTCTHSLSNGFLINTWPAAQGSYGGYEKVFGTPASPPPSPPFWVEWRFASNNAIHGSFINDGIFVVGYNTARLYLYLYGDAIIWEEGGTYVEDLPLNEFRTYRFESPDGNQWCSWVDGKPFLCGSNGQSGIASLVRMAGSGGSPYATVNRWDYVRYGRMTTGETIVSADPPAGYLDPEKYTNFDRFTVTFDQPNYVYIDDIVVDVEGNQATRQGNEVIAAGIVRVVTATRRKDNGPPDTVEIVLDQPLASGATYRFAFDTGAATPQTVEYIMTADPHPVIPTTTTWGLVILSLLLAIAAKLNFPALTATP